MCRFMLLQANCLSLGLAPGWRWPSRRCSQYKSTDKERQTHMKTHHVLQFRVFKTTQKPVFNPLGVYTPFGGKYPIWGKSGFLPIYNENEKKWCLGCSKRLRKQHFTPFRAITSLGVNTPMWGKQVFLVIFNDNRQKWSCVGLCSYRPTPLALDRLWAGGGRHAGAPCTNQLMTTRRPT